MSSDSKTIRNATDAYVTARRPNLSKPNTSKLILDNGGTGDQRQAFLFFSLPFPFGSSVDQDLFRLTQSDAFTGGAVTVTVQLVTAHWNVGRLTWNNRPAATATNQVTLTKTNPGANTLWEFDLKTMMQSVSTSGVWWGLKVSSNNNIALKFYSAQGATGRPEMAITWSDLPLPPDNPSPSGGRAVSVAKPKLSFTYEDDSGNTQINALQIQYKATNTGFSPTTGFTTPTWDSGTYATSTPEIDTSTVAGAPAVNGTGIWWTARAQDGNGVWSEWMDPENFIFTAPMTFTLDNPPVGGTVTDATPPVLWTVTSGVQQAYRVTVYKADDPTKILWNSGKITTPIDDTAIPDKVLKALSSDYVIDVWLWDNVNREANGGNPIYAHIQRTFQFVATGSVGGVTSVVATQNNPWPWVDVTFDRATAADEYNIFRDGEIIANNVPAADLSTGSTHYSYRDKLAAPRVSHVWSVQAVVNSVASNKSDSNAVTTRLLAPFMMETDASNPVYFLNPTLDPSLINIQEVQQPVNAPPVLLTQFIADKYQGHLEGIFHDESMPTVTARQMRDRFKKWKKTPGNTYILYMVDEVLTICPYNMTYKPRAYTGGVLYEVSFDFFEVNPA
jgi:hypothetical protein